MKNKGELIVALDVDTFEEARSLIDLLSPVVDIFKVGSQLFTSCGPVAVRYIVAKGKKVFLDLKFHDIPNTVANAVSAAVGLGEKVHDIADESGRKAGISQGVFMLTLHTAGGREMLGAAVKAALEKAKDIKVSRPILVGVTVLTSESKESNMQDIVLERALLARNAGLDGVVASGQEAGFIRKEFGENFVVVTPGIRPSCSDMGDQKRVATPAQAVASGSNFLVVGRPIVKAGNPYNLARQIIEEINRSKSKGFFL